MQRPWWDTMARSRAPRIVEMPVPASGPSPFNAAHNTFFVPIGRPYELPTPTVPLFKDPNLYFTPGPSYINLIANDPGHPLHYMAQKNGSRLL